MSAAKALPFHNGIRTLADRYDTFIVDLWGTLHDGIKAYPGAVEALVRLKAHGKTVVLLSNAPHRVASVARGLKGFGIAPDLYALAVTAGEAAHAALRDRSDAWHARLRGPCWHLGPTRDRRIFEGLNLDLREQPAGCGFCVVTGTSLNEERVEDYQKDMDLALSMELPMICANPDRWVPAGDAFVICAGAFAEYYSNKGGDVFWHGKPHAPIYRSLFSALEMQGEAPIDRSRTIALGDGLATDIAGAAVAGIDNALLPGGVHRLELRPNWRGRPREKLLAALLDHATAKPTYILRRFSW